MTDYPQNPKKIVVISGYVRSGNTWLTRLIADCLDSPAIGFANALPLATEGEKRAGDWFVSQLHLHPVRNSGSEHALVDGWKFDITKYRGEHLIIMMRDPRDVAISAMHYWDLPDIKSTLIAMRDGSTPLGGVGRWTDYVNDWMNCFGIPLIGIHYEALYLRTEDHLFWLLQRVIRRDIGETKWRKKIREVIARQEINAKRKEILEDEKNGIGRPYGATIQLKHLRRGVPGEWREVFTKDENDLAWDIFGVEATLLGYSKEHGYEGNSPKDRG